MIGVFDSGVGGLPILKEIRRRLPQADLIYLADNKNSPYGPHSRTEIIAFSEAATSFLLEQGAGMVVVACNSATTASITKLRERFNIPFVGVVPAVKVAAGQESTRRIGVICTKMTAVSDSFERLVQDHCRGKNVRVKPCPALVETIERGETAGPRIESVLKKCLAPLVSGEGVNTLVIGCTHFSLVVPAIKNIFPGLKVTDAVPAVARQAVKIAKENELDRGRSRLKLWSSGLPENVQLIARKLFGPETKVTPVS